MGPQLGGCEDAVFYIADSPSLRFLGESPVWSWYQEQNFSKSIFCLFLWTLWHFQLTKLPFLAKAEFVTYAKQVNMFYSHLNLVPDST